LALVGSGDVNLPTPFKFKFEKTEIKILNRNW